MNEDRYAVFLGTAAAIQLPSFHCDCEICHLARKGAIPKKTRSALAIIDEKTVLIDPGPDIAFQLEREGIRKVDAIFITHWHYDHVGGLGEFGEPAMLGRWDRIQLFLSRAYAVHFENDLRYMKNYFDINPIYPGSKVRLGRVSYEAVRTTHCPHSLGYIIAGKKKYAYLVDGIRPPQETIHSVLDADCLILEASVDELDKEEKWMNLDIAGALKVWKEIGTAECILTHMSFHSWKNKQLIEGYTQKQREVIVSQNPGLTITYDGMRVTM